MRPTKKYLRNKIVYNFFTDIRNNINKQFFNIGSTTNDNKKIHPK
jgi:hypothetical protein